MENILIIGIVLLCLGALLVVWRFLHMWYLGEFWNNTPTNTKITWGITALWVGASMILVLILYLGDNCPDNCTKSGDVYATGLWMGAIICVAFGAITFFPCCKGGDDEIRKWDWGDDEHEPMDERRRASGVDMVFFFMGLAIVWSHLRLGTCPVSCGVAVVATPAPSGGT